MICQKCQKENSDGNKFCNYCGETLSSSDTTNSALTGGDRLKIGWLFAILIIPFGGFGMAIIPILILLSSIYIMKKDKNFLPILNAKKYIKIYLTLLALGWIIGVGIEYHESYSNKYIDNPAHKNILNPNYTGEYSYEPQYISNGEPYDLINPKLGTETFGVVMASTIGFSIIGAFLMFLFNTLFFNVLKNHEKWVINNGIFADADKTYSDIVCSNCGSKLKTQGGFCPNCGHKG